MLSEIFEKKEKKVEYIELIYDLIFVYIIGRNNSLLHHFDGGFVGLQTFLIYALCTLAVIQIWSFTTFYINMFGKNSAREYIFLFINMYLLYFIAQSTRSNAENFLTQYHIAWGLILVNVAVQYLIELFTRKKDGESFGVAKNMCFTLIFEAVIAAFSSVLVCVILSYVAVASGIILTIFSRGKNSSIQIDFTHLSERIMLYVVFTFGEMIIAISSYFEGNGKWNTSLIYFSLMAFLIVAGLFLSYGFVYDNLIDREGSFNGMLYMIIHIFIIFALNNITVSLEFMREEEIDLIPKMIFLVASLILYFVFLLGLKGHAKCNCKPKKSFILSNCAAALIFIVLMIVFRENMAVNIFVSVLFVYTVFLILYFSYRKLKEKN